MVVGVLDVCVVFFFKQKTAYERRISDWSSDVCSSDLSMEPRPDEIRRGQSTGVRPRLVRRREMRQLVRMRLAERRTGGHARNVGDRKSVVEGKSVSVRVDLGGRRIIKQKSSTSTRH